MGCLFCFHLHSLAAPLVLQSHSLSSQFLTLNFCLLTFCSCLPASPLRKSACRSAAHLACAASGPPPPALFPKLRTPFCHSCSCCSLADLLIYPDTHLFWCPSLKPQFCVYSLPLPLLTSASLHSLRRPLSISIRLCEKRLVFLS